MRQLFLKSRKKKEIRKWNMSEDGKIKQERLNCNVGTGV
jgi:hypothetical protein